MGALLDLSFAATNAATQALQLAAGAGFFMLVGGGLAALLIVRGTHGRR